MLSKLPNLTEQQASLQKGYDAFGPHYEQFGGGTPLMQNFRVAQLITHSLGYRAICPKSMLDLGAGTGLTIATAQEVLHIGHILKKVTAVDLSGEMLEDALSKKVSAKLTVVHDSIENYLNNASEDFDLITSVGTFDFIPDLPNVLHKVAKIVKPGGVLAATYVPRSADDPGSSIFHSEGLDITFREYFYTPEEIESRLSQSGLDVIGRHAIEAAYNRDGQEITYNLIVAQAL